MPRTDKKPRARPLDPGKFVVLALQKQHAMIGATYDPEACKNDGWYRQNTWTPEQRQEFRKWFVATAVNRLGQTEIRAETMFAMWDLGYGWSEKPSSSATEAK